MERGEESEVRGPGIEIVYLDHRVEQLQRWSQGEKEYSATHHVPQQDLIEPHPPLPLLIALAGEGYLGLPPWAGGPAGQLTHLLGLAGRLAKSLPAVEGKLLDGTD